MSVADKTKRRGGDGTRGAGSEVVVSYETDPYSWSLQQARLLREGQFDRLDRANLADEIEDVARRELRATRSALRLVIHHLLKWDGQPQRRSRSWEATIRVQRREALRQLEDNPGLRAVLPKLVAEAYEDARDDASGETGLPVTSFPLTCPYNWDDIMSRPIEGLSEGGHDGRG